MGCTFPWCGRPARSVASGLCSTHYEQKRLGREPMVPTEPLLALNLAVPDLDGAKTISLGKADDIACEVLHMHPAEIWGSEWFDIPNYI